MIKTQIWAYFSGLSNDQQSSVHNAKDAANTNTNSMSETLNEKEESSAKLTNQRVSYAFTSSPLSFHGRHILPTSKFQHSHYCIFTSALA